MTGRAEMPLARFPSQTFDKLRWSEAVHPGHVANVAFPEFCETGRAEIVHDTEFAALTSGFTMFVARLAIDYRAELHWPGRVEIGTGIAAIGRSSVTLLQGLFQDGKCAARAETVLVQVDDKSRRTVPLSEATRSWLAKFLLE